MFGLYGAFDENEVFTAIYSVLTVIVASSGLLYGVWTDFRIFHWSGSLWYVLNSLVAVQFLGVLKQRVYLERVERIALLKSYDVYPNYELNKL